MERTFGALPKIFCIRGIVFHNEEIVAQEAARMRDANFDQYSRHTVRMRLNSVGRAARICNASEAPLATVTGRKGMDEECVLMEQITLG